jgi:hypothetical protein
MLSYNPFSSLSSSSSSSSSQMKTFGSSSLGYNPFSYEQPMKYIEPVVHSSPKVDFPVYNAPEPVPVSTSEPDNTSFSNPVQKYSSPISQSIGGKSNNILLYAGIGVAILGVVLVMKK